LPFLFARGLLTQSLAAVSGRGAGEHQGGRLARRQCALGAGDHGMQLDMGIVDAREHRLQRIEQRGVI
jgi:hypothetical protein